MIEKLEIQEVDVATGSEYTITERVPATNEQMHDKINELVDMVNFLDEEYNNQLYALSMDLKHKVERIEKLEKLVSTLVEENNTHEEQIDKLQMKVEPEKCDPKNAKPVSDLEEAVSECGGLFKFGTESDIAEDVLTQYDHTTTYLSDGKTKRWFGQDGAWVSFDPCVPRGYRITIGEESDAKPVEEAKGLTNYLNLYNEIQSAHSTLWNKLEDIHSEIKAIKEKEHIADTSKKIKRAADSANKNLDNALEIAVDALKRIAEPQAWSPIYAESLIAKDALAKIAKILKITKGGKDE